jgi:glucosinolate gamma-glutamyl hydrolase
MNLIRQIFKNDYICSFRSCYLDNDNIILETNEIIKGNIVLVTHNSVIKLNKNVLGSINNEGIIIKQPPYIPNNINTESTNFKRAFRQITKLSMIGNSKLVNKEELLMKQFDKEIVYCYNGETISNKKQIKKKLFKCFNKTIKKRYVMELEKELLFINEHSNNGPIILYKINENNKIDTICLIEEILLEFLNNLGKFTPLDDKYLDDTLNIGILNCSDYNDCKVLFSRFFNKFKDLYGIDYKLTIYNCINNKFPSNKQIENYDGFLITGSKNNCDENLPWIRNLISLIKKLKKKNKKIVGLCFGHQIIQMALGGSVKNNRNGWQRGIIPIQINKNGIEYFNKNGKEYFNKNGKEYFNKKHSEELFFWHQQEVRKVANNCDVLGETPFSPNSIIKCKNIISTQGHPEFDQQALDYKSNLGFLYYNYDPSQFIIYLLLSYFQ